VHVGVDEAGDEVGALDVQPLASVIAAQADDVAVLDGDVDVKPFLGEDRKDPPAGEHELGRLVPPRDRHPLRVDDGQDTAADTPERFSQSIHGQRRRIWTALP